MSLHARARQAPRTVACVALAVTLAVAPGPLPLLWGAADTALARDRGGGARGARAGVSRSAIERSPRAASAATGSVRLANRGGGQPQLSDRREVARAERGPATAHPQRQLSAERTATPQSERATARVERRDERPAGNEARRDERAAGAEARRGERSQQAESRRAAAEERRGDRAAGLEEARDQRSQAFEDLQENRQDALEALQEDRQEFMEDLADEREELWEEVYDDRDYWDDDDDDDSDEWLWGIVGGLAGGVAGYAIGSAVNAPPEGAVSVPVAGAQPYAYYGGAFYQPAPDGEGYVTAPAPVGATVDAAPLDCTIVYGPPPDEVGYCYFQGAFFTYNDDIGQYVVAEPPAGVAVPYLPEGFTEEEHEGVRYLKLGGYYYRPYFAGEELQYVVADL